MEEDKTAVTPTLQIRTRLLEVQCSDPKVWTACVRFSGTLEGANILFSNVTEPCTVRLSYAYDTPYQLVSPEPKKRKMPRGPVDHKNWWLK